MHTCLEVIDRALADLEEHYQTTATHTVKCESRRNKAAMEAIQEARKVVAPHLGECLPGNG